MTTLADLFDEQDAARDDVPAATRGIRARKRLAALVGGRRAVPAVAVAADDTDALIRLVGERAPAASVGAGAAPTPKRIRRGRSGRDWLSIGAAVFAVLAVAGAVTVTGVSLASASPASSALNNLTQNEAVLVNSIESVDRSIASAAAAQAEGIARAEALATPLAAVAGMTDEPARQAAEAARAAYVTAATAVTLPSKLPVYRREAIDRDSLESVGAAIDAVNERSIEVQRIGDEVSTAKVSLARADQTLAEALATFAATVPVSAAAILSENPDAVEQFALGVTNAVAAVAAADLTSANGPAVLTAYAEAVAALRTDQARAVQAIAEEAERTLEEELYTGGGSGGGTVVESDPAPPSVPGTGEGGEEAPANPDTGGGDTPVDPSPTTPPAEDVPAG